MVVVALALIGDAAPIEDADIVRIGFMRALKAAIALS